MYENEKMELCSEIGNTQQNDLQESKINSNVTNSANQANGANAYRRRYRLNPKNVMIRKSELNQETKSMIESKGIPATNIGKLLFDDDDGRSNIRQSSGSVIPNQAVQQNISFQPGFTSMPNNVQQHTSIQPGFTSTPNNVQQNIPIQPGFTSVPNTVQQNDESVNKEMAEQNEYYPCVGNTKYVFRDGILYENSVPKMNCMIRILSRYHCYDDINQRPIGEFLDLEFSVYNYGNPYPYKYPLFNVDLATAQSSKVLSQIPGFISRCRKPSELNDFMYCYINDLLMAFPHEIIYRYTLNGWKKNLRTYITANGAIGNPLMNYKADGDFYLNDYFQGDLYQEYLNMCKTLKNNAQMKIILLYVLSSFMYSLFRDVGFPMKHTLVIMGPRGSKKTALAKCFTQFGADKNETQFNFQSTDSGIQYNFKNFADRVMLIDDLSPSMDFRGKAEKERKLETILRLVGDSGTRTVNTAFMKNNADGIDYSVRGGVVITCEYFYDAGSESSIARAVVIELQHDSVDENMLSYFQRNTQILESLVYRFISYVTANYILITDNIPKNMQYFRGISRKYKFSNARYYDYFAHYMTTGNILANFFQPYLGINGYQNFMFELENDLVGILKENDNNMKYRAPVNVLMCAISYEFKSGNVGKWGEEFSDQRLFITDDENLYFRQMDLPGIMEKFCRKTGRQYVPMSSRELGGLLETQGYCQGYQEGSVSRKGKRYAPYAKTRLMSIPLVKIEEFEQQFEY